MNRHLITASLIAVSVCSSLAYGKPVIESPEINSSLGIQGMHDAPIHYAARVGNRAAIEKILRADLTQRDATTPLGTTPLHFAAMNPDPGALMALIAAGARIDVRDSEGVTPLHMAAFTARSENTATLLKAGADPKIRTNLGHDALTMARKVRSDEVSGILALWLLKGCQAGSTC